MKTRKLEKLAKKALETFDDVLKRREQVQTRVAQTRTKETEQERASRRRYLRERKTASRAKQSEQEKAD